MIYVKTITSSAEFRQAMGIRKQVFIDEQKVPEWLESDEHDINATHVIAYINGLPVGTGRVYLSETENKAAYLGHVAVLPQYRNKGIATAIIRELLEIACDLQANKIIIHSQIPVISLYQKFGFKIIGKHFLEAGIPHIKMQLNLDNSTILPFYSTNNMIESHTIHSLR